MGQQTNEAVSAPSGGVKMFNFVNFEICSVSCQSASRRHRRQASAKTNLTKSSKHKGKLAKARTEIKQANNLCVVIAS